MTRKIYLYFTPLTLLVYVVLPHGYFLDIATSYMMKNQLHASPEQVAAFRLVTAIPVYFSFVFGFARDLWNPLGMRDRGYFLIFGPVTGAVFIWMALSSISYAGLLAGMVLVMLLFRFVAAANQGLMALIGQEKLMSGRLSALWNIVSVIPWVIGAFASGYLVVHVPPRTTFIVAAALSLLIGGVGLWKPRAVFSHAYDQPAAKGASLVGDLKRLVRHRAVYPAVLIMLLFQFMVGANTPLQYYLTIQLHASDAVYGYFNGIFLVSFLPMFLLYGFLCKRVKLKKLLWWGSIISMPQMVPLLFIHSGTGALWMAAPMGLMGGICGAALIDLAMRSCPAGLQGTLMMMVDGAWQLSSRLADIVGARIYSSSPTHGFLYCVMATTFVYFLAISVIPFIPKEVVATTDGESVPPPGAGELAVAG